MGFGAGSLLPGSPAARHWHVAGTQKEPRSEEMSLPAAGEDICHKSQSQLFKAAGWTELSKRADPAEHL